MISPEEITNFDREILRGMTFTVLNSENIHITIKCADDLLNLKIKTEIKNFLIKHFFQTPSSLEQGESLFSNMFSIPFSYYRDHGKLLRQPSSILVTLKQHNENSFSLTIDSEHEICAEPASPVFHKRIFKQPAPTSNSSTLSLNVLTHAISQYAKPTLAYLSSYLYAAKTFIADHLKTLPSINNCCPIDSTAVHIENSCLIKVQGASAVVSPGKTVITTESMSPEKLAMAAVDYELTPFAC